MTKNRRELKLLRMAWVLEGLALAASILWAQNLAMGEEKIPASRGRSPASLTSDDQIRSPVSLSPSWYNDSRFEFSGVQGKAREFKLSDTRIQLMGQFEKNSSVPYLKPSAGVGPGFSGK